MNEFAVKIIGDEDDAYDYINQFDGELMDKVQASFDKDCEEVYYFKCFVPEEHKDEALNDAPTIFREEQITEQYEENWGKLAEICPLEELEGKQIESIVIFEADEEGLTVKKQIDMREGYTREEFLDAFNSSDVDDFGLEFPEDVVGEDEQDEFYYNAFVMRLENKLWDSPEAEETKFQLGSILSFWEDVV